MKEADCFDMLDSTSIGRRERMSIWDEYSSYRAREKESMKDFVAA